ncbi:MAG TPA: DnaA/Hda family protein, partial [Microthrixaceae bacterium]|nr:DnaA/Hda family protein [Microthrixaceae bacterium]
MAADAIQLWAQAATLLAEQVSDAVWSSTFQDVSGVELVDDTLTLSVPSQLARQRIESRYMALVTAALIDAGHPNVRIVIEVKIYQDRPEPEAPPVGLDQHVQASDGFAADTRSVDRAVGQSAEVLQSGTARGDTPTQSNNSADLTGSGPGGADRYTFESFVIGPSNRFAHAAALSVAETPARSYNPLFVYGDAGLGKTHLLQAISHYVREIYPSYTVRYISTETLLNEFVDAIRKNSQPDFKRRYREIDVLLVDDIQFLEGKEQL